MSGGNMSRGNMSRGNVWIPLAVDFLSINEKKQYQNVLMQKNERNIRGLFYSRVVTSYNFKTEKSDFKTI